MANNVTKMLGLRNHSSPTFYSSTSSPFQSTSAATGLDTFTKMVSANESSIMVESCLVEERRQYPSFIGIELAIPQWEAIFLLISLGCVIILTIVGNILVVLSVFTYKPLRIVQNFFIVSLAVADLTVAILVLPFNVANIILGRWVFGIHMCKMWLTSDVLCCTSSILNLCAIALDRYWAITDPINYAQKRTVERVLLLIAGVWVLSLVISSPPLIGWNDWPESFDSELHPCALNSNPGYRVYSALGSFFIPLIIMTIVYIEIFIATRRRLRERANATRINATNLKSGITGGKEPITTQQDQESISSETIHNEHPALIDPSASHIHVHKETEKTRRKDKKAKAKDSLKMDNRRAGENLLAPPLREDSITDVGQDNSSDTDKQLAQPSIIESQYPEPRASLPPRMIPVKKPSTVYQFIEEKQRISLSKERRAARTLGIIMGVFIACWVPFFMLYIIVPFCPTCCPSERLIEFLTWLGYLNSALNPIIYTIFNLEYRRAFKRLLGF